MYNFLNKLAAITFCHTTHNGVFLECIRPPYGYTQHQQLETQTNKKKRTILKHTRCCYPIYNYLNIYNEPAFLHVILPLQEFYWLFKKSFSYANTKEPTRKEWDKNSYEKWNQRHADFKLLNWLDFLAILKISPAV